MTFHPPTDPTSLSDVIAGYVRDGYDVSYFVTDEGLRCPDGSTVGVADVEIHSLHRLEGASDPADEVDVAAIDVTGCGLGTVVLRHGADASPAEAELLAAARDQRGAAGVPRDTPTSQSPTGRDRG